MTVAEFKSFLLELARQHMEAGESDESEALCKLAELFDANQNLKVAKFVEQLKRVIHSRAAV